MLRSMLAFMSVLFSVGLAGQVRDFIELEPKSHKVIPGVQASLIQGVVRCDESNVYFTPASLHARKLESGNNVLRVSRDGKVTQFSLSAFEGFENSKIEDYAPNLNGEVILLTGAKQRSFLLFFDRDGAPKSKIRIEAESVHWSKVGVFGPDALFLWGERVTDGMPISAISNHRGQILRNVVLPNDIKPQIEKGSAKYSGFDENTVALHLSVVTSAENRVYLARATPEGPIYIIKATGEAEPIHLHPPSSSASFYDLKVSHGLLAIVYVEPVRPRSIEAQQGYITVLDGATGQTWRKYLSKDPRLGFALGCYDPDDIVFIGTNDKGELDLVHAGPK